jgi:hypothetical protein
MNNLKNINVGSSKVILSYSIFLLCNIYYYLYFTVNFESIFLSRDGLAIAVGNEPCNYCFGDYSFVLNGDTLKAYLPALQAMIEHGWYYAHFEEDVSPPINRGYYVSFIYYFLWLIFQFEPSIKNVIFFAFLLNNLLIIISYIFFVKIGRKVLGLTMRRRWLYFCNPSLIYISQVISKEIFILTFITIIAYLALNRNILFKRKLVSYGFLSALLALTRLPFAFMVITNYFFKGNKLQIPRVFLLNLALLLMAGYYYSSLGAPPAKLKDAGVTSMAFTFNYFYLGPLLIGPLKILASFYNLFDSAIKSLTLEKIDLYHATTIPICFALLTQFKSIFFIIFHPIKSLRSEAGGLLSFVLVFIVIVICNVFVHARYLWPILPLMILMLYKISVIRRQNKFYKLI